MSHDMKSRRKEFQRNKRLYGVEDSSRRRGKDLSPRENFICRVACVQVLFLGWSLGSMHLWAQYVNLGLSVVAVFGLLLPDMHSLRWDSRASGIRLLPRSALFWLGLIFVCYVGVQCFNNSWKYQQSAMEIWRVNTDAPNGLVQETREGWQLVKQDHVSWLPSGVEMPYGEMNVAARILIITASVWLWACVLSTGLSHRRALRSILWAMVLGGTSMALLGAVQRLSGTDQIFWLVSSSNPAFFGTFIYPNHAAAFLYLILGVVMGLAFYHHSRSVRKLLRSGPHYILIFFGLILFLGLFFSQSKAGLILGSGVFLLGIGIALVRMLGQGSDFRQGITLGILSVLGLGFGIYALIHLVNLGEIFTDFETLQDGSKSPTVLQRVDLQKATWSAFNENKWFGTGAGSFRYHFPFTQQKYPGLRPGHDYFEYAHSDYLQSLMEFGLLGCLPLFLFFFALAVPAVLASLVRPSVHFSMLAGVLAFCLHAWWDFPAQCPSVLLLLVFILVIIGRWGTLDVSKQRIDNDPL